MSNYPNIRLQRLRQNQEIRDLLGAQDPAPSKFIYPIFVIEGSNKVEEITSMQFQFKYTVDNLSKAIDPIIKLGINSVILFPSISDSTKTLNAENAYSEKGLIQQAIVSIKSKYPNLLVFTDVCLCGYTSHGHCGVLDSDGNVLNDATLDILTNISVSHANAGANGVAPSAMMDGQIHAIRKGLEASQHFNTILMSYSTKFASSMYGPFRDAASSAPAFGDRKKYQMPYNSLEEAIRESVLDKKEGADILMVKPSLFYLDIISKVKEECKMPVTAYNVSGEYSMLHASANAGYGDLYAMAKESLHSIFRAGSDFVISYWANQYDKIFNER